MDQKQLWILADAEIKRVIDGLTPEQWDLPAPQEWARKADPTLRDIVRGHAKDEAWVPDVLAGRTIDEVGDRYSGELLGDDPIATYDGFFESANAAVREHDDLTQIVHLSYGDYPVSTFYEHTMFYRAFQAWSIGHFLGNDVRLPDELVAGLTEIVTPQLHDMRAIHVFGPEVEVAADADAQTKLLGMTGFWRS
ncbi:hypothetical protein BH11ACT3_BH11ACT3_18470 [soil metagenome]